MLVNRSILEISDLLKSDVEKNKVLLDDILRKRSQ